MKRHLLFPAAVLLLALPLQAEELPAATLETPDNAELPAADVLAQLRELIRAGDYPAAWALASHAAAELEGEPEFDFYYGLSAAQTGNHQPALFSFERLSASFPQVQRYRLELARSYFFLGNLDQADTEFRRVLADNPPDAVRNNIQRFLDRIDAQRNALTPRWQSSLSLAGGYDSNINSATSAEQIELFNGLLTATLQGDQRRTGSPFWQLRGISSYQSPLSRRSAWDASAAISRKDNTDDAFDLNSLNLQTGLRWLHGQLQLRGSLSAAQYWLDNSALQQDIGVAAELYWRYTPALQPFARLQLNRIDSDINDDLDVLRPQLQTGLSWNRGALSTQAALSYASDNSRNDADYQARDTLGVSLSAQYSLSRWDIYANLLWRDSDFQAASTDPIANGRTRSEQLTQALTGVRYGLTNQLSAYAQLSYLDNDSNLAVYDYHRALSEAGLTLTF